MTCRSWASEWQDTLEHYDAFITTVQRAAMKRLSAVTVAAESANTRDHLTQQLVELSALINSELAVLLSELLTCCLD